MARGFFVSSSPSQQRAEAHVTRSINFSRLRIALPVPRLALVLVALAMLGAACTSSDDSTTATATATRAASALPDATVAPAPVAATTDTAYPLTIVDSSDTDVEISAAPTRVISYSPAATEILFAIGAGDLVVAADQCKRRDHLGIEPCIGREQSQQETAVPVGARHHWRNR